MGHHTLMVGLVLAIAPLVVAARAASPEVSLETALAMPDAELAATCNRASVARKYVELARAGSTVTIGRRRVTARNADAVAADIDAQLDVCREAIAQRGVAEIGGVWAGSAAGCERAGSLLAQAMKSPGSGVRFEQDGITLAITVFGRTSDGEDFSFPASGTVVGHYIAMIDPGNSDYLLQGEATEAAIVLRPDAKSVLAAWPVWAGPPKPEDLASCAVSLQRSSGESAPTVAAPEPHRDPYEGIPPSSSPLTDITGWLTRAESSELNRTLELLWKKRRLAISVLVMQGLPSETIESFTQRVVHARGTGGARGGREGCTTQSRLRSPRLSPPSMPGVRVPDSLRHFQFRARLARDVARIRQRDYGVGAPPFAANAFMASARPSSRTMSSISSSSALPITSDHVFSSPPALSSL